MRSLLLSRWPYLLSVQMYSISLTVKQATGTHEVDCFICLIYECYKGQMVSASIREFGTIKLASRGMANRKETGTQYLSFLTKYHLHWTIYPDPSPPPPRTIYNRGFDWLMSSHLIGVTTLLFWRCHKLTWNHSCENGVNNSLQGMFPKPNRHIC